MAGLVKAKEQVYSGEGLVNFSPSKKPILTRRVSNSMALYGSNGNDTVNDNLATVVCVNFVFGGAKLRKSWFVKRTNAEPFEGVALRYDGVLPISPIDMVVYWAIGETLLEHVTQFVSAEMLCKV